MKNYWSILKSELGLLSDSLFGSWIDNPRGALFVTALPVASTICFAAFKEDIVSSFPFYYESDWGNLSGHAVLFWSLLTTLAVSFYKRQSRQDKKIAARQAELIKATDELMKMVRTMPPALFLGTTVQRIETCITTLSEIGTASCITKDELTRTIQLLLEQIAQSAANFDGAYSGERYAANIMLFKPIASIDFKKDKDLLKFTIGDRSDLIGALEMQNEWSVAIKIGPDEAIETPDSQLASFSLPVPTVNSVMTAGRMRTLPGAPLAYVLVKPVFYSDVSFLTSWMKEQQEFPQHVIEDVVSYFQSERGQLIKSFASFPIRQGESCIGVVNIHRNKPGILRSNENEEPKDFASLLIPFCSILFQILSKRYNIEEEEMNGK